MPDTAKSKSGSKGAGGGAKVKTARSGASKPAGKAEIKKGNGKGVDEMVTEPSGQRRLPGQAIKVVKELVEFGERHEITKDQHSTLTSRLEEENGEGIVLYQKHKAHFEDDGKGGKIYEAGGIQIIIPGSTIKIKTKRVAPPDAD